MYEFLKYLVRDVMTKDVVVVGPNAQLHELEGIFDEGDFNGVPVLSGSGKVVGMVTRRRGAGAVPDQPRTCVDADLLEIDRSPMPKPGRNRGSRKPRRAGRASERGMRRDLYERQKDVNRTGLVFTGESR